MASYAAAEVMMGRVRIERGKTAWMGKQVTWQALGLQVMGSWMELMQACCLSAGVGDLGLTG
jgi:hypothetical protein